MAGLYIHIPFCASRCIYCGFYSSLNLNFQQQYVDAVCTEIHIQHRFFEQIVSDIPNKHNNISTIYLGGGTPSLLLPQQLSAIFRTIADVFFDGSITQIKNHCEVTIECNPDDITPEFAHFLSQTPINRVSMGVQTFDNQRLSFLHRRHKAADVSKAIMLLKQEKIKNISIDLIFGFPLQTLAEWENDIQKAIELNVQHLSAYSLTYEEGTPLYNMWKRKQVEEIDEELSLTMFQTLVRVLKQNGFEHYEISNFAKHGFRSRHNSNYWHDVPYLGIGAAAHSYNINTRQWNISNIKKYIQSIENNCIPCEKELLNNDTRYNDTITTALRTCEGINLSNLQPKYRDYLLAQAKPSIEQKLLTIEGEYIRLTQKGIFVSDNIMSDLIFV